MPNHRTFKCSVSVQSNFNLTIKINFIFNYMSLLNFITSTAVTIPMFTTLNVTFDLTYFAAFIELLFFFKISNFLTREGRGAFSTALFVNTTRTIVAVKMLHKRYPNDANIMGALSILKNAQIPVWQQNILNCVPIFPASTVTTVNCFGQPFTVDANEVHGPTGALTFSTAAFPATWNTDLVNYLARVGTKSYYVGELTKINLTTNPTEIFQFEITVGTDPAITSQPITFPKDLGAVGAILGLQRNYQVGTYTNLNTDRTFSVSHLEGLTLSPQLFLTGFLIRPIFNGFNFTVFFTTIRQVIISGTFTVLSPQWYNLCQVMFVEFPNPDNVGPSEISTSESPSSAGNGSSSNSGNSSIPAVPLSQPKLRLTKIRKTKEAKVSKIFLKVTFEGLQEKSLTSDQKKKVITLLAQASLQLEKAANILQVESGGLISTLQKAWKSAAESVDPNVNDQK